MDVDPLGDAPPPRYNVESDDEEDEYQPLSTSAANKPTAAPPAAIDVTFAGTTPKGQKLLIAAGDAGAYYARGAELGEQTGAVYVNKVQVGLIFRPSWTQATVLISEALVHLPLDAMHIYAKSVLENLQPSSFALLDTYPAPIYASAAPIPFHDAPLRFLSTSTSSDTETTFISNLSVEPFSPPNLLQSTSASFLSLSSLPSSTTSSSNTSTPTTLILLPSPRILPPPPRSITHLPLPSSSDEASGNVYWPRTILQTAQEIAFRALGAGADRKWSLGEGEGEGGGKETMKRRGAGVDGMYI